MAGKRTKPATDWEAVELLYRAGQLSVSEIARQHGITSQAITMRAKRSGWKRDLTKQVRDAVRAKLLDDAVTDPVTGLRTGETIAAGAEMGASVVRTHRKDLASLRKRRDDLMSKFDALVEQVTEPKHLSMLSGVLSDAAGITAKVISGERQAFNLDDEAKPNDSDGMEQSAERIMGKLARLAAANDPSGVSGQPAGE